MTRRQASTIVDIPRDPKDQKELEFVISSSTSIPSLIFPSSMPVEDSTGTAIYTITKLHPFTLLQMKTAIRIICIIVIPTQGL